MKKYEATGIRCKTFAAEETVKPMAANRPQS